MSERQVLRLHHLESGRDVPIEKRTVVGRNDTYYRYVEGDARADRLRDDVATDLASLDYIKVSSDSKVSRYHAVVDPGGPTVSDLNSTNGTRRNGVRLPVEEGEVGPRVVLRHGDVLTFGKQEFVVDLGHVSEAEHQARVRAARRGFVASDRARLARAQRISHHLTERKGFTMRPAVGWPAAIANCYHLQSAAHPEGVAVAAFVAEARGSELLLDDEPMELAKLLPLLANVPGRKVLVLDVDGDPFGCERVFADGAFEDMLLLVSPGGPALGDDADALIGSVKTGDASLVRRSVSGESPGLAHAFDDALDGLEALLRPDTNVLATAWADGYAGRLKVLFGARPRQDDSWLSHTLRFGSTTYRF
jgi:hypothetical protein